MMNKVKPRQSGFLLLAPSAILAIVVVFSLLFLMQFLIKSDLPEPDTDGRPQIADIWQEDREIEDQFKERKIEEIDEPEEPPPDIPKQDIEVDASVETLDLSATRVAANVDISLGGGFSDGDIIPLVAIQPDYPRRALQRGIEGYVVVTFTITTQGLTRDVVVVESTDSIFDRSAVRAAERLKYKPRIIDGRAVEVDHFYKFTFELAE
jgi:protein TonB